MPSGTVNERRYDLKPPGWYTAKLLDVRERAAGKSTRLVWKWEILEGEFAGQFVWGECWGDLDQGDGCVWRRWHEALVERAVDIGENIDTDDVLNMLAQIFVHNRSYESKKHNDSRWQDEVPDNPIAVQPISADVSDVDIAPVQDDAGIGDTQPVGAQLAGAGAAQPPW
jgi:hypothetical protein